MAVHRFRLTAELTSSCAPSHIGVNRSKAWLSHVAPALSTCGIYDVPRALLLFARLRGLFARPRFEIFSGCDLPTACSEDCLQVENDLVFGQFECINIYY